MFTWDFKIHWVALECESRNWRRDFVAPLHSFGNRGYVDRHLLEDLKTRAVQLLPFHFLCPVLHLLMAHNPGV